MAPPLCARKGDGACRACGRLGERGGEGKRGGVEKERWLGEELDRVQVDGEGKRWERTGFSFRHRLLICC